MSLPDASNNQTILQNDSLTSLLSAASALAPVDQVSEIAGIFSILERQNGYQRGREQGFDIICFATLAGAVGDYVLPNIGLFGGLIFGAVIGVIKNRNRPSPYELSQNMPLTDKIQLLIFTQRMVDAASTDAVI